MAKNIYFKDYLFNDLFSSIHSAADFVTSIGKVVKSAIPDGKWTTDAAWAVLFDGEYIDLYRYLEDKILSVKAEELSLDAGISNPSGSRTAAQKDNLNIVKALSAADLKVLEQLRNLIKYRTEEKRNIKSFFRCGALYIGADGRAVIADDYEQRLKDFCTVTLVNEKEEAFYKNLKDAADNAKRTQESLRRISDSVIYRADVSSLENSIYHAGKIKLCEGINLLSDSMLWRAMLKFIIQYRKKDTPKFYNREGCFDTDVYTLKECFLLDLKPTSFLRIKYPAIYKDYPFGTLDSEDTEESFNRYKKQYENKELEISNLGFPLFSFVRAGSLVPNNLEVSVCDYE